VNILYWREYLFDKKLSLYVGMIHPNEYIKNRKEQNAAMDRPALHRPQKKVPPSPYPRGVY